ncbi:MAG: hypothetical protein GKR77_01650 [Legionellales bacterium]|nr:hypothetical protein [Legionellales bacterium]
MNQRALSQITRIVVIQGATIAWIAALVGWLQSPTVAYSLGIGGLIGIVPNLLAALIMFWHQGSQYTKQIITAFYLGEMLKWVITAGLFGAVFLWLTITPWAVLIGFIVAQMAFWLASIQHVRKLN